jgi:RsiW-degrading membrane proteinase PrsW (M82 family)
MPSFEPLYLAYGGLALLPAIIWLSLIYSKQSNKKFQILLFILGSLSVVPIFLIQYLFSLYPQFDLVSYANNHLTNPIVNFLILYAWVAITEELVKQWMIRFLDGKFLLVQTINDSIRLSLISALGFSFAENIFYFYQIGTQFGVASLLVAYLFRSIFTTCAHLVFSGFFGYFYGIAKFSISIVEQSNLQGKKLWFSRFLGRIFNISRIQAYQEATILKGLFTAILLHMVFNFSLEMNSYTNNSLFIGFAAVFIFVCYMILRKILKNKAGSLVLVEAPEEFRTSTMAKTDEDVVIELLGMWFNKGKYVDVIHICERLLKRDPTNKIVNLFKAKALDQMEGGNPYKTVLSKLFPDKQPPQK